jgi:DNA-binding MarR family transcriptional regulator
MDHAITIDKTTDQLVEEVKAANDLMEVYQKQIKATAQWKARTIAELRWRLGTVVEVAERLGVSRQAVYMTLTDVEEQSPIERETREAKVRGLTERFSVSARQLRNMAIGKTPNKPIGPVGLRMLAEDLEEAVALMTELIHLTRSIEKDKSDAAS